MEPILFRYRGRVLTERDIESIRASIDEHYERGRSHISRVLCRKWNWIQPNGKLKEYAARDLLLRLEENNFVCLPPRIKPKNNLKEKSYSQIPLFFHNRPLVGTLCDYAHTRLKRVSKEDNYLFNYLLHHYHYLGTSTLVGEHLRYLAYVEGQAVGCLSWSSAAYKVKSRDKFIGWDATTRRNNLHLIANNARFLILPWIRIKNLASHLLALSVKVIGSDWQKTYGHQVYLAETFVDNSRFKGTCYKAANWQYIGQTSGSAKKGNTYRHHGQPKAVYLYPLHRNFRRLLNDEKG